MLINKPIRQYMSPQNIVIDPSESNKFSLVIDGSKCVAYRFSIYDFTNNRIVPPSGDRVSLSPALDNGETLEITVAENILTAGENYKWMVELYANNLTVSNVAISTGILTVTNHNLNTGDMIYIQSTGTIPTGYIAYTQYYIRKLSANTLCLYTTYEGAKSNIDGTLCTKPSTVGTGTITISNVAISEQCPFYTYSTPSLVLTPTTITAQKYEFIPTYTHTQDIPINSFVAELYNSDDVLINSSGTVYSSNIKYSFDGLLSGSTIKVKFTAINIMGQECTTGLVEFEIDYPQPTLNIKPIVTNNYANSSMSLYWEAAVYNNGVATGTYQYIEGGGIHLDNDSQVKFNNFNIELANTDTVLWIPDNTSFAGEILTLKNTITNNAFTVGYNGTAFYRNINGEIYLNYSQALNDNKAYIIAFNSTDLVVKEVDV